MTDKIIATLEERLKLATEALEYVARHKNAYWDALAYMVLDECVTVSEQALRKIAGAECICGETSARNCPVHQ